MATHLRPGERGSDVMKRLGRKDGWFGCSMLDPDRPAPTITKSVSGKGTLFHWERRHVAISEALALTGFPPGYQLPGSFGERWARVGNSVAPPMTREIAQQVLLPLLRKV